MLPAESAASPTTRLICACTASPVSPEYPAVPLPAKVLIFWPDAIATARSGNTSLLCISNSLPGSNLQTSVACPVLTSQVSMCDYDQLPRSVRFARQRRQHRGKFAPALILRRLHIFD